MIEDKAFQSLLRLYLDEADHAHMKEAEVHGDYTFLIKRRDTEDEWDRSTYFTMEMFETGSDKFKITMDATRDDDEGGCYGNRDFYIKAPVVEHVGKGDPCQVRMAQMFLKKATLPFTLYVYHAIGIKV